MTFVTEDVTFNIFNQATLQNFIQVYDRYHFEIIRQ
jgi:hypothetical protein